MYKEYHELFSNEVYQATACYVFWNKIQNEPAKDKELLAAFQQAALSWNTIRHSMMVSLIMTLERIFDTDGDTVSVDDLIKGCINEVDIFSKENLRTRKLSQPGFKAEWIDDFIGNSFEPTSTDLHKS